MLEVVIPNTDAVRVCRRCGCEKSVDEFGWNGRWRRRVCRRCQYDPSQAVKRRARNKTLYGTVNSPNQLRVNKLGQARRSARNREMYGTASTPGQLERFRTRNRNIFIDVRGVAVPMYGGKCECCGESDPNKLTFDHIGGNRSPGGVSRVTRYTKAIAAGYPNDRYRLLCYNCNIALGVYGYCPHNGRPEEESLSKSMKDRRRAKLEFIVEYGGRCSICGETMWEFLSVDHINGGGKQHRKDLGVSGSSSFYRWLKKQGWPKDGYRLLCLNCNCSSKLRYTDNVDRGVSK